jgi:hypothetical protein
VIVRENACTLESLSLSVREDELSDLVDYLISMLQSGKLCRLRRLSIYITTSSDGSVRIPIDHISRLEKHHLSKQTTSTLCVQSLIIQGDPGEYAPLARLVETVASDLITLGFLGGCSRWIRTSRDMVSFLMTMPNIVNLHLGACNINVDMDEVIPHVLASAQPRGYIQYTNASASIETLKLIRKNFADCYFDGIGFLAFLI